MNLRKGIKAEYNYFQKVNAMKNVAKKVLNT